MYKDVGEAKETITYLISQYDSNNYPLVMAVVEKQSGELIGHVGLSEIKQGVEIGYAIGIKHQGRGYAKEAVTAYSDWAKDNLKLDKLFGVVDANNKPSCAVLSKSGFSKMFDDTDGDFGKPDEKIIFIK